MSSAAYIVQHEHTFPLGAPGSRRAELSGHGLLVANPAIPPQDLTAAVDTGALVLAAMNSHRLSAHGPGNPFFDSMRAALSKYVLLHDGAPVLNPDFLDPYFDFRNQEGARAYAQWMLANITGALYLDDLYGVLPWWRHADFPDRSIIANYAIWISALLLELRRLAPLRIIIGNTGGWTNVKLNGICIEQGWHTLIGGEIGAVLRYTLQATTGYKPTVNIDWSGKWNEPLLGIARGVFFADARAATVMQKKGKADA